MIAVLDIIFYIIVSSPVAALKCMRLISLYHIFSDISIVYFKYKCSEVKSLPRSIYVTFCTRTRSIGSTLFEYLMKLHYSQTSVDGVVYATVFEYLMKLHYSQTILSTMMGFCLFEYLMKLHYSQTHIGRKYAPYRFEYLMKLHDSQTKSPPLGIISVFEYLMKLHYSQTYGTTRCSKAVV